MIGSVGTRLLGNAALSMDTVGIHQTSAQQGIATQEPATQTLVGRVLMVRAGQALQETRHALALILVNVVVLRDLVEMGPTTVHTGNAILGRVKDLRHSTVKGKQEKEEEKMEEERKEEQDDMQEEDEGFDPVACAKLYNRLIRIGFHGSKGEKKGQYLQSVLSPSGIDDDLGPGYMHDHGIDCVGLFPTNHASIPHRLGLVIDLDDFSVRYLPSFFDYHGPEDTAGWYSLRGVLLCLNAMVDTGKYVPTPDVVEYDPCFEPGWKAIPWTDSALDETLAAWEDLVNTIAIRLPNYATEQGTQLQLRQLASEDKIPSSIRGFTRGFLLRASKPPFKYIAPGLMVYDSDAPPPSIPTKRDSDGNMVYASPYKEICYDVFHDPIILCPFEESTREDPAGLWILPKRDLADSFCLVLPYQLEKFHTTVYGKYQNGPTRTALFQSPICPFYGDQCTGLKTLFIFWKSLVEKGVWTVGADGIEGGKEFYRQAEDEEKGDWFDVGECLDVPLEAEINIDD
ncbi:hypothetical protein McanMca71_002940 [Microsporum canis]